MHMEYNPHQRLLMIGHDSPTISLGFDCATVYYATIFKDMTDKESIVEHSLEYINRFMQSRTPYQQELLANYYWRVHNLMYSAMNSYIIDESLQGFIDQLPQLDGYTPRDMYLWTSANVTVPPNIMSEYRDDLEGIYSKPQTYVRQEYLELAGLILYSKLLMPIMGEYMRRLNGRYKTIAVEAVTADMLKNTLEFKPHVEMIMFDMLSGFVEQVPGFTRLLEFITISIDKGNVKPEELLIGKQISMEDLPYFVMSSIFTRKMVGAALFGTEKNHLASRLFTNIRSIIAPGNDRTTIKLSNDGISKESGDDVKSVYDDSHAQYSLSIGQIAILQHCCTEEYLFRFVLDKIDEEVYRHLYTQLLRGNYYVTELHVAIVSVCLGNVLNPVILSHCDQLTLLRLIAITYLLISNTYPDVADVLIGFPLLDDMGQPMDDHVPLSKLTSATISILQDHYSLQTKRGLLLIQTHIDSMDKILQRIWCRPEVIHRMLVLDNHPIQINSDFLNKYAVYLCTGVYLLDPPQP